tara:strand:+ start:3166 stop:3339 length:174 start_codon:yes stop_codon:yes gene_type:complete
MPSGPPIDVSQYLPWIKRQAKVLLAHQLLDFIEANAGNKRATLSAVRELRALLKQKD